jgi:hypothetical protein
MGAKEVSRERFEADLERLVLLPQAPGSWKNRFEFGARW